jgi:cell division protein FtsB
MVRRTRITPIDVLNVAGILIALYLAAVLSQTIYYNYTLNRSIETLRGEISLLQAQQEQFNYNIAYYKTDSFKDREARAKLGLQLPGEAVLILPNPHQSAVPLPVTGVKPVQNKSNFGQWLDFLGGNG